MRGCTDDYIAQLMPRYTRICRRGEELAFREGVGERSGRTKCGQGRWYVVMTVLVISQKGIARDFRMPFIPEARTGDREWRAIKDYAVKQV